VVASIADPAAITQAEAERVFDDLLEAMRIDRCQWQPDVVAALLGDAPAVVPAWAFGHRGPGQSYSSSADDAPELRVPGIRVDDEVPLRWAREGEHPDNPFEQSDGRPYRPGEELAVHLAAGDWLEFELTGADAARVTDADGADAPVTVERTARGVRVTASAPTSVSVIHPSTTTRTW
jgi:hypothetical protein